MLLPDLPAAIVFDLDGTIVDTEDAEFEAIRLVWADHGADYTIGQFEHVIGTANGVIGWYDELVVEVGRPLDRPTLEHMRRGFHRTLVSALQPREGVMDLIGQARAAGVPLAVASNSPRWWVQERVHALGLSDELSVLVTFDEAIRHKPDPAPFLQACELLGADPALSVAFEDSATGVASARAAGLYTVACPCPLTVGHDLSAANRIISSHAEISLADLARDVRV